MKNFTIFFSAFLCAHTISAQLNVRNDYYLFVEDEVLFVEDNVNLQEADSKIYLRDESQLIQGSGSTGNSGIGQLSTYQNGTTNEYSYNFWCSPVGNNSASTGNENFTASLIDNSTGLITSTNSAFTDDYNGSTSPLTISRRWIYTLVGSSDYDDWNYVGDAGDIAPGLGYTMKGTNGSSNNQLYDFRGKPNNGTITNTLVANEWTLIGNPYPSAIDALDFIHDTDNIAAITGTLYYWEQDLTVSSHNLTSYIGGFSTYTINAAGTIETFVPATFNTYNADGSLNTTGSSSVSGKQARRYIPIGQGFLVEGNGTTSGTVSLKNSYREYYKQSDADSEFYRTLIPNKSQYTTIPKEYKRFRLNIDFNDNHTRQLVQTFHDTEATDGFDYGLESKYGNDTKNAYWTIDGEAYLAQALAFDKHKKIPLTIELSEESTIRIRITDIQHFNDKQPIYIHDILTNTYTNIRNTPFETTLTEGKYSDVFEVTFIDPTLKNEETLSIEDITNEAITIYQNNTESILHITTSSTNKINTITVYDALGNVVFSNGNLSLQKEYKINTEHLSNGIYITQVISNENVRTITKVLVKN